MTVPGRSVMGSDRSVSRCQSAAAIQEAAGFGVGLQQSFDLYVEAPTSSAQASSRYGLPIGVRRDLNALRQKSIGCLSNRVGIRQSWPTLGPSTGQCDV